MGGARGRHGDHQRFVLEREDFNRIKGEYVELRDVLKKVSADKSEALSKLVLDGVIL